MDRIATTKVMAGPMTFELPPEACRRLFLAGALRYCKGHECFELCPDDEDQIPGMIYALKCLAIRCNVDDGPGATRRGHPAEGVGPPHELADELDLDMSLLTSDYRGFFRAKRS